MTEDRAAAAAGEGLGTVGERRRRLPSRRSAAIAIAVASPDLPSLSLAVEGLVFPLLTLCISVSVLGTC